MTKLAEVALVAAMLAIPPGEQLCLRPTALAAHLAGLGFEPDAAELIYVKERDQKPSGWTQLWSAPGWRVLVRGRGELACVTAEGRS